MVIEYIEIQVTRRTSTHATSESLDEPAPTNLPAWSPKPELHESKNHCSLKLIGLVVMFNLLGLFLVSLPAMAVELLSNTTGTEHTETRDENKAHTQDYVFSGLNDKSVNVLNDELNSANLTPHQHYLIFQEARNSNKYESVSVCVIKDFTEKRKKAEEAETDKSFLSDPFVVGSEVDRTSNNEQKKEYRMRMKLYPNGDGTGRGTHCSLYFSMTGESDAGLTWPYDRILYFTLLDQSLEEIHIKDSIRTNTNHTSWVCPDSPESINPVIGSPHFVKQALLQESDRYLKNDTLLIVFATKKRPTALQWVIGKIRQSCN